jgi:pentatricopeptide repeat protein
VYQELRDSGFEANSTTYNALISAYGKLGQLDRVLEVYKDMVWRGLERRWAWQHQQGGRQAHCRTQRLAALAAGAEAEGCEVTVQSCWLLLRIYSLVCHSHVQNCVVCSLCSPPLCLQCDHLQQPHQRL